MWESIANWLSSLGNLAPLVTINQYERGVVLRLGKFNRENRFKIARRKVWTLGPGLHLKIPLVERVLTVESVETTKRIQPQTLTTKDGQSVTTSAVITYQIERPEIFLLEVWEGLDAINDVTLTEIKRAVVTTNWENLIDESVENEITKKIRHRLKKYGVAVDRFGFADFGRIRTIRLITDHPPDIAE